VSAEVAAFKGLARQFPKGVSKPWGRPSRFWEQADFHGNVALFSLDARRGHRTLLVLDHDQFRAAFTARMLCEQVAIALYWPAPGGNWCCERIHQRVVRHGNVQGAIFRSMMDQVADHEFAPRRMHRGRGAMRRIHLDAREQALTAFPAATLRELCCYADPQADGIDGASTHVLVVELVRRLERLRKGPLT